MDITKRYNQMNDLICYLKHEKLYVNDPISINLHDSIRFAALQINNKMRTELKKKEMHCGLRVIQIHSKLNNY